MYLSRLGSGIAMTATLLWIGAWCSGNEPQEKLDTETAAEQPDSTATKVAVVDGADRTANEQQPQLPNDATILTANFLTAPRYTPDPVVSPDGQKIAFVSAGSVFVCNVAKGPPKELVKLPNTITAVLAGPDYTKYQWNQTELLRIIGSKQFRDKVLPRVRKIYGFAWLRSSDGIIYATRESETDHENSWHYTIWRIGMDGKRSKIAEVPQSSPHGGLQRFELVCDGRMLLLSYLRGGTVFYDLDAKEFRGHQFANIVASGDGKRFLGIEADTGRLVLVDDQLQVTRRLDVSAGEKPYGIDLEWSPDEQFILLRKKIGFDHYSNWTGFRLNLNTGERRNLAGLFFREHIQFTGRGGEIVRCGLTGRRSPHFTGNEILGARLTLVPEGDAPEENLWRVGADSRQDLTVSLGLISNMPPFVASSSGQFFAVGIPRQKSERHGWVWHLVNRDGKLWPLPGKETGQFYSPYMLIDFADDDQLIVARDDTRIFAIPVPREW